MSIDTYIRTWHIYNAGKTLYKDHQCHEGEFIMHLENKQQSEPNNGETQHKHMYL